MCIKSIVAIAVLTLSTLTSQVKAAETWTLNATGHLTSGTDATGIFGLIGQSLVGMSFTQTITASINPAEWENYDAGVGYQNVYGDGVAFLTTFSVNGRSASFTASGYGEQLISSEVSIASVNRYYADVILSTQMGWTTNGNAVSSGLLVSSATTAFVPTASFNATLSLDTSAAALSSESLFVIYGANPTVLIGKIDFLTVNAVPEPETYAMMLAGLGILGFAARRKRTAA